MDKSPRSNSDRPAKHARAESEPDRTFQEMLSGKLSPANASWLVAERQRCWLGAQQLREDLACEPFYAKRAARALSETGDEMTYWLSLYGSAQYSRRVTSVEN